MSTAISMETAIALAGAPKQIESARLREIEEREISALASHVEQGSDPRFYDLFCANDDDNLCAQGARKTGEKAYAEKWAVVDGKVLCPDCQQREDEPSDNDVLADEYYDELKDRL